MDTIRYVFMCLRYVFSHQYRAGDSCPRVVSTGWFLMRPIHFMNHDDRFQSHNIELYQVFFSPIFPNATGRCEASCIDLLIVLVIPFPLQSHL